MWLKEEEEHISSEDLSPLQQHFVTTAKKLHMYLELFGHIANAENDESIVHYLLELYGFLNLKLEGKNSILMTNTIM